jgi:ABC-type nitrate/sulfonate/bicarbonate transport system substrate-binding protein
MSLTAIRIVVFLSLVAVPAIGTELLAASGEVIITHSSMSTTAIPLWLAQRQNFFGKYGVKSKVVWVRGNPVQIATLASGDTQMPMAERPQPWPRRWAAVI